MGNYIVNSGRASQSGSAQARPNGNDIVANAMYASQGSGNSYDVYGGGPLAYDNFFSFDTRDVSLAQSMPVTSSPAAVASVDVGNALSVYDAIRASGRNQGGQGLGAAWMNGFEFGGGLSLAGSGSGISILDSMRTDAYYANRRAHIFNGIASAPVSSNKPQLSWWQTALKGAVDFLIPAAHAAAPSNVTVNAQDYQYDIDAIPDLFPLENEETYAAFRPAPLVGGGDYNPYGLPERTPTDYALYFEQGGLYTRYLEARAGMDNPNNSWGERAGFYGFAFAMLPVAWGEEYACRTMMNAPFYAHNAGIAIGESSSRIGYYIGKGDFDGIVIESLHLIKNFSEGFVALGGVAEAGVAMNAARTRPLNLLNQYDSRLVSANGVNIVDDVGASALDNPASMSVDELWQMSDHSARGVEIQKRVANEYGFYDLDNWFAHKSSPFQRHMEGTDLLSPDYVTTVSVKSANSVENAVAQFREGVSGLNRIKGKVTIQEMNSSSIIGVQNHVLDIRVPENILKQTRIELAAKIAEVQKQGIIVVTDVVR